MVPTEILARQHLATTLRRLRRGTGHRLALLTGREKGRRASRCCKRAAAGEIDILVGTHALFQEDVDFREPGLVVIDEQHRFGVHQRLALQAKAGSAADLLVMTATPIPRTLALTVYGDMDVSQAHREAGRAPADRYAGHAARAHGRGHRRPAPADRRRSRAYWVCPLVEESELVDLAAAEDALQGAGRTAFPDASASSMAA